MATALLVFLQDHAVNAVDHLIHCVELHVAVNRARFQEIIITKGSGSEREQRALDNGIFGG